MNFKFFLLFISNNKNFKKNKPMKRKSLIVTIISALVLALGAYSGFFNSTAQSWMGIVSFGLVTTLSVFAPSGAFEHGMKPIVIVSNAVAILLQVANLIGEKSLMDAALLNGIVIGLNIFTQTFLKDYSDSAVAKMNAAK
jgi:hypothetical protein